MAVHGETRKRALREAGSLLQLYGYAGFTYQQLATALGIKKPSLCDHFESKEDLVIQLVSEFRSAFERWTRTIEAMDPRGQLHAFFDIFFRFAKEGGKYCPLAVLGAEMHSLPPPLRDCLNDYLRAQSRWLQETIAAGQKAGVFREDQTKRDLADCITAMMIGAQFLGRIQDPKKVVTVREQALNFLQKT